MTTVPIAASYVSALRTAIVLQLVLMFMLMLILDGGKIASAGGCAIIGFWVGATWVIMRRRMNPGRADLLYVRWGYLPLLAISVLIAVSLGEARL
jgi:hypothetical protein